VSFNLKHLLGSLPVCLAALAFALSLRPGLLRAKSCSLADKLAISRGSRCCLVGCQARLESWEHLKLGVHF
jgi:hypothetical protein